MSLPPATRTVPFRLSTEAWPIAPRRWPITRATPVAGPNSCTTSAGLKSRSPRRDRRARRPLRLPGSGPGPQLPGHARGQPLHVPLGRTVQGLAEVVDVEDQAPFGGCERTEVGQVSLTAQLDPQPRCRRAGQVGGPWAGRRPGSTRAATPASVRAAPAPAQAPETVPGRAAARPGRAVRPAELPMLRHRSLRAGSLTCGCPLRPAWMEDSAESPAGLIEGSGHISSGRYTHSAWITQMSMAMIKIANKGGRGLRFLPRPTRSRAY